MFTILDYSSALEYSIIRRYTNIVYYRSHNQNCKQAFSGVKMSIDIISVKKCQHVSVTWLEQANWKHDTQIEVSNILLKTIEQVVPVETRRANQRWMTNEILDMMEEGRLLKHNECI